MIYRLYVPDFQIVKKNRIKIIIKQDFQFNGLKVAFDHSDCKQRYVGVLNSICHLQMPIEFRVKYDPQYIH
jgi:hypothetical protein